MIRIACTACHGHGKVDLPAPYRATLAWVGHAWTTTAVIWKRHGGRYPSRTALINRLNALVRWGFVDRRSGSRTIEWRKV